MPDHGIARHIAAWLVVGLLLAGCASEDPSDGGTRPDMDPSTATDTSQPPPSDRSPEPSLPVLTTDTFLTPSGNIGCTHFEGTLACEMLSGLDPQPDARCPQGWVGAVIDRTGYNSPICGDVSAHDPTAPTLEYEQTWAIGELTCESQETGLRCQDGRGVGFTLARSGWSLPGKEIPAKAALGDLRSEVRRLAAQDIPGTVYRVNAPTLLGSYACGGRLQGALVIVDAADYGSGVHYTACFVYGEWRIEGPAYGG